MVWGKFTIGGVWGKFTFGGDDNPPPRDTHQNETSDIPHPWGPLKKRSSRLSYDKVRYKKRKVKL